MRNYLNHFRSPSSHKLIQTMAILGSFCICTGVFTPVVNAPFVGKMSLFMISGKHAVLLVLFSIIVIYFSLLKTFKLILATGIASGLTLISAYYSAKSTILGNSHGKSHWFLKNLQDAVMRNVDFKWGLAIIVTGISFIIIASAYSFFLKNLPHKNQKLSNPNKLD